MARPKLKGKTIGLSLLLTVDAEVRRRAEGAGLSPGVYLAGLIERSIGGQGEPTPVASLTERRVTRRNESNVSTIHHPSAGPGAGACPHKHRTPLGGGLYRCSACQKTRGVDGVWR